MSDTTEEFTSVEALKSHEVAARHWMATGVASLLSLWNARAGGSFRHTEDVEERDAFRPTATFHSLVALAECGVWHPETSFDERRSLLRLPDADVHTIVAPPSSEDILRRIIAVGAQATSSRNDTDGQWLLELIESSSHARSEDKKPSSRFTIPLERLVSALSLLMNTIPDDRLDPLMDTIRGGLATAESQLRRLLTRNGAPLDSTTLYESGEFSPAILFYVLTCFDALQTCYQRLQCEERRGFSRDEIEALFKQLRDATLRNIDYHMARHAVTLDPSYDPVSLTFALRALCVASPEERRFAFFRACVDAVVVRQHEDGCWPDGVSITFEPTADVVQQPSVGVALHLAECGIHNRAVTDQVEEERTLLFSVLPALRRTMQYLSATYTESNVSGRAFTGWSSDRIRRRNYIEAWITALSTRLLRRLWIGEKAALRNLALSRLGVREHRGEYRLLQGAREAWQEAVSEPDSITRPTEVVFERIIAPVLRMRTAGDVFQRPAADAVSFIVFGPPGSGKTFFVQRIAQFIGWPLVTITPGHFIHRGLEFIEAVARQIFDFLSLLNHAVVFFDECDELFRSRDDETQRGARSILSFATASMLPKLQDLHDAANVVFVLGTNYLRIIDTAVRRPGRFDEVLLFDRPDDAARERVLHGIIGECRARSSRIAELTSYTRGLTVKEVRRVGEAALAGRNLPSDSSIEDYREWCRRDGPGELQASRLDKAIREMITARWNALGR